MKKYIVSIAFVLGFCLTGAAQITHTKIVEQLETPSATGARVTVKNHCNVILVQGSLSQKVRGYRVRIYFDNGQQARSEAQAATDKFTELYPNVPTYLDYTAPYFKVTVGNFLTKEEAIKLLGNIVNVFPNAFIVSENMPLDTFLEQKPVEKADPASESGDGGENTDTATETEDSDE